MSVPLRTALPCPRTASRRDAPTATVAAIALLVVALLAGWASPAEANDGAAEAEVARRMAQARAEAGVGAVTRVAELDRVATDWARQMAASGQMSHNPDLATQVAPASSWAENVGWVRGPSAAGADGGALLHRNWMDSASHRDNILGARFDQVGIGIVRDGDQLWASVVFRERGGDAGSGRDSDPAPAAEPAPQASSDAPAEPSAPPADDGAAAEPAQEPVEEADAPPESDADAADEADGAADADPDAATGSDAQAREPVVTPDAAARAHRDALVLEAPAAPAGGEPVPLDPPGHPHALVDASEIAAITPGDAALPAGVALVATLPLVAGVTRLRRRSGPDAGSVTRWTTTDGR